MDKMDVQLTGCKMIKKKKKKIQDGEFSCLMKKGYSMYTDSRAYLYSCHRKLLYSYRMCYTKRCVDGYFYYVLELCAWKYF